MERFSPFTLVLGALLLFSVGACANRRPELSSPFVEGDEAVIRLTVDNQDYRDATIFLDWNGVRQRIGMVIGKTTETFTAEWRDYEVRIEVDFVGGGEMKVADPIQVQPQDHIDFVILPGW